MNHLQKVTVINRLGFTHAAVRELPPHTHQLHYHIGEAFAPVWEQALQTGAGYILMADSAIPLPANLYLLMLRLMDANPQVHGITINAAALASVYGLAQQNMQKSPYSVQDLPVLPAWLCLLRTGSWNKTGMNTPEFFLLEQSAGKQLKKINAKEIPFDSFRWAGDIITFSAEQLAGDYRLFLTGHNSEEVPLQFRVTVPGNMHRAIPVNGTVQKEPVFSIITPSIRPEFLPDAVESVLNQEYPNWELWIGVDGPKESIRKRIEEVLAPYMHDGRIHAEYCQHMGTGPMRRFLSEKAQGDYIVGLDDDDRLKPHTLRRFAETVMANPGTAVLRGGIQLFGLIDAYLPPRVRYRINGIPNDLFEANQPYAVNRKILQSLGGLEWDPDLKNSGEDSDLLLKADREELPLIALDEPLYERRLSTYNQTLDCTADECLKHVHNMYGKHTPATWSLQEIYMTGNGPKIRMHTRHNSAASVAQIVCSTEFMNFQQVGSREGVVLDLEITSLCNAVCVFCPREKMERSTRFISLEHVRKVAESVAKAKFIQTVVLCGIGESTMHPELGEIISLLAKAGANVCMTTNGWRLNTAYVDMLAAAGLSELNVSLNAFTAGTHWEIMQLKHFDEIHAACEEIARQRRHRWPNLKFHVSFVMNNRNVHEEPAFVQFWEQQDVTQIWLHKLTNRAGQIAGSCQPVDVEPVALRYADNPKILVDMFPGNKEIANMCHIAKQVDFISVDGSMLLCAQDYGAKHQFGNIMHEDLDGLHNNKLLHHLRGRTAATCSQCSFCPDGFKTMQHEAYSIVQSKDYD